MSPNGGAVKQWSVTFLLIILCIWGLALLLSWWDKIQDKEAHPRYVHVELQSDEWEGILWTDAEGYVMGMAVRERLEDGQKRSGYTRWSVTDWGNCDSWSEESEGGYCLIRRLDLAPDGSAAIKMHTEPDVAGALP